MLHRNHLLLQMLKEYLTLSVRFQICYIMFSWLPPMRCECPSPHTGTLWVTSCDLDYLSLYSMFLNTSPGYGYSSLGCILTSIVQISVRTKAIVGYTTDVFGHRSFTLTHSISPYRCREPKIPAVALLEAIEFRWLHNSCSRALHTTVMDTQLRLCPIATVVVDALHCKVLAHRLTRISEIL